eukprot:TRINITY_DN643_c1_g1_i2.p1 TRINITY_DN643_c1_g1~~TRINITY_DN643_c1_g1_i2.p1  ORF type:complete len:1134 (+),score=255.47 TRINITY_DN643_c1_g1_i2:477-3404(+)
MQAMPLLAKQPSSFVDNVQKADRCAEEGQIGDYVQPSISCHSDRSDFDLEASIPHKSEELTAAYALAAEDAVAEHDALIADKLSAKACVAPPQSASDRQRASVEEATSEDCKQSETTCLDTACIESTLAKPDTSSEHREEVTISREDLHTDQLHSIGHLPDSSEARPQAEPPAVLEVMEAVTSLDDRGAVSTIDNVDTGAGASSDAQADVLSQPMRAADVSGKSQDTEGDCMVGMELAGERSAEATSAPNVGQALSAVVDTEAEAEAEVEVEDEAEAEAKAKFLEVGTLAIAKMCSPHEVEPTVAGDHTDEDSSPAGNAETKVELSKPLETEEEEPIARKLQEDVGREVAAEACESSQRADSEVRSAPVLPLAPASQLGASSPLGGGGASGSASQRRGRCLSPRGDAATPAGASDVATPDDGDAFQESKIASLARSGPRTGRAPLRPASVDVSNFEVSKEYQGSSPDGATRSARRTRSSSGYQRQQPAVCRNALREGREKVSHLEETLLGYERDLDRLEGELERYAQETLTARSGAASSPAVADGSPVAAATPVGKALESWLGSTSLLQRQLEELSGDALEYGCSRATYGAMDVFGAASAAIERMSGLMKRYRDICVEADAPALCDPVEWRIASAATTGPGELAALRQLLQLASATEDPSVAEGAGASSSTASAPPAPELRQPATLLRFLRAKEGRAEEALEMLLESVAWRARYRIRERSAKWRLEAAANRTWLAMLVEQYRVHEVIGHDRFGLPVYLFRWSAFDITGAERELGADKVLKIILCIHEELANEVRKAMFKKDELSPGCVYIWDIGNYGQHGVPGWWGRMLALVRFLPKVAKLLETNYPEMVRKIMVLRCGPATKMLYHAALPLIPSRTLSKCQLHGWRASQWKEDLLEELCLSDGGESLPAFLLRDDADALAAAVPKGGLYPVGAKEVAKEAAKAAAQAAAAARAADEAGASTSAPSSDGDSAAES